MVSVNSFLFRLKPFTLIGRVEELEAPRYEKNRISYELEVLKKKIGGEIETRLKLRAVQSSTSK